MHEGDVVVAIDGQAGALGRGHDRALGRGASPGDSLVLDVVDSRGPRRVTVTVVKRPATLAGP